MTKPMPMSSLKSNNYTTHISKPNSKRQGMSNGYSHDRNLEGNSLIIFDNLYHNNYYYNKGNNSSLLYKIHLIKKNREVKSKPVQGSFYKRTIHNYFSKTDLYY